MKQALWDKLLSAAQGVVNDAEHRQGIAHVDGQIMDALQDAVQEISDDAWAEIQRIQAENRAVTRESLGHEPDAWEVDALKAERAREEAAEAAGLRTGFDNE